jgi:hypothetical protein
METCEICEMSHERIATGTCETCDEENVSGVIYRQTMHNHICEDTLFVCDNCKFKETDENF